MGGGGNRYEASVAVPGSGFKVLEFGVSGFWGLRFWGLGFQVQRFGGQDPRVYGLRCWGWGLRVLTRNYEGFGLGFRV